LERGIRKGGNGRRPFDRALAPEFKLSLRGRSTYFKIRKSAV